MYQSETNGLQHELGTSGFLYRSNKLMYDQATKSLWSTLQGKPVVGPLVGHGIELQRHHVVTTTWGQWRQRHPNTQVLSIETGYDRDYDEGAAYREYFSNDDLMFSVPDPDIRMPNKAEVVALRDESDQLAISAAFLRVNPLYHDSLGDRNLVILTSKSGANRVYFTGNIVFESWDQDSSTAVDSTGGKWTVTEDALVLDNRQLPRAAAHRAFWFGWHAQFPDTRLVK